MSRGINKVILIGNLGADPETRYMPSGSAVTNIRVATTDTWKDRQTGEQQERTEWHRVVMFARLGEIAAEYLRKGSQVYLEGRLQTRKWQGQDGTDRWTTEIVANEMQMLGGRRQSADYSDSFGGGGAWERTPAAAPPPSSPSYSPSPYPPEPSHHPSAPNAPPTQSVSHGDNAPSSTPFGSGDSSDDFDNDVPF